MSGISALILCSLLPVLFSVGFYLLERTRLYARLSGVARQTVIGAVFGLLAVFSTEFGVDIDGAIINVRDAAPLAAGLIFGAPAGIIAGVIGGVERWLAPLWGGGAYTRLACTLATMLAGLIGAGARRILFDDKKPGWFYGLAIGMTAEVLHMLLIFLTNMGDTRVAFSFVRQCAAPMILANSLSVMLSVVCVSALSREKRPRAHASRHIAQAFQRWLLLCVAVAFAATSLFTWALQTRIAAANTDDLLILNARDVRDDISDASDKNLLALTRRIQADLGQYGEMSDDALRALAERHDAAEINLVGADGVIAYSSTTEFVGYDMAAGAQSAFFLPLLEGADALVQSYQPIAYDASLSRKYAGVSLRDGGFLQVGYDAARFQRDIDEQVVSAARNRHIGRNGCVIICSEDFTVISDREGHEGENLPEAGLWIDIKETPENARFTASVNGVMSYCAYLVSEGYYIVAVLPVSEAAFSRDIAVYITAFMEVVIFAALFILVYFLIKRLIVENIRKVNASLGEITGGNLNITVDVRSNAEFASLSDDINATVSTLKAYIAEAAARIDKELEFARAIQRAALPSVFPPYPGRRDFDVFASMDAAKEVGGDFYDFYLLGRDTLAFLIADVSGKGIPAALFMMRAKTLLKGLAESGLDADRILAGANDKLCEGNEAGMFVTAWMGMLDLRTGLLRYANAGHNPPMLCRAGGAFEYVKAKANFVLGGMESAKYRKNEMKLMPGDVLFLYTDGVTEATDSAGRLFGEERLAQSLNASPVGDMKALCARVKRDVDGFVGEAPQFDDITMFALRVDCLRQDDGITVFPDAASASLVTDYLDARIGEIGLPVKAANKLRIAADEVFTNIRSYSGASAARVSLAADREAVSLRFMDDGAPYDPLRVPPPDINAPAEDRTPGGLGIWMVKKLMDDAAYAYEDGWNTLTLTLRAQSS